jgi:hypothetical protein
VPPQFAAAYPTYFFEDQYPRVAFANGRMSHWAEGLWNGAPAAKAALALAFLHAA